MASRIISFLVIVFLFANTAFSQESVCGTQPTQKDIQQLKALKVSASSLARMEEAAPVQIAISAHVARRSDGTGGLTQQELNDAITGLNEIYSLTNMTFFLLGDINHIDDDNHFDFNTGNEDGLTIIHDVPETINVYFFNTVTRESGSTLCGYAYFPSSEIDHIIMKNSCTNNGSTFPHEIGHYFSLYHTHGKTNTGTTDELVDGSNCQTAGDDLCDTAADPNLSGKVSDECRYTGSDMDANGAFYDPNAKNLMSYSRKHCRDEFSPEQAARIVVAYQEYKTYLIDKNFLARFDAEDKEVCQGDMLSFTDKSVGAESYEWTFEGGTPSTSSEANPAIAYNTPGMYDVTLRINVAGGDFDTKVFKDYIVVKEALTSDLTEKNGSFEEESTVEQIINDDQGVTFSTTSEVASDGTQSIFINFLNYSARGQEDYLVLNAFNSTVEKTYRLTFDYAYAPYDNTHFDGLAVVQRDPCGDWITVWEKFGTDLETTHAQVGPFVPRAEHWKSQTVGISIPEGQEVTEIAFKSINGYGNNLYLDKYEVAPANFTYSISDVIVTGASCSDRSDGSLTVQTSRSGSFLYSRDGVSYTSENEIGGLAPGSYEVFTKNEIGEVKSVSVDLGYLNEYPETPVVTQVNNELVVALEDGQTAQWYGDGVWLENETSSSLSSPKSGTFYFVEVSNGNCSAFSDSFLVLGLNEIEAELEIYPNPTQDQLKVVLPPDLQKEVVHLKIRDLTGKIVESSFYKESLDVRNLESGLYLLELSGEDFVVSRRFLKR